MRQLFVEELKKVEGGTKTEKSEIRKWTTLACCEEGSTCCI
jgi:hypothetical protein